MIRPTFSVSLSLYFAVAGQVVAPEPDRGAQLAASCASCHRLDGHDVGIPPLAGSDAERLIDMMQAYRSNERPSLIMHAVSLSLSADEIQAVARYMAALHEEGAPR
jgi:cytochrome subunit of sulfide dehydrogenase